MFALRPMRLSLVWWWIITSMAACASDPFTAKTIEVASLRDRALSLGTKQGVQVVQVNDPTYREFSRIAKEEVLHDRPIIAPPGQAPEAGVVVDRIVRARTETLVLRAADVQLDIDDLAAGPKRDAAEKTLVAAHIDEAAELVREANVPVDRIVRAEKAGIALRAGGEIALLSNDSFQNSHPLFGVTTDVFSYALLSRRRVGVILVYGGDVMLGKAAVEGNPGFVLDSTLALGARFRFGAPRGLELGGFYRPGFMVESGHARWPYRAYQVSADFRWGYFSFGAFYGETFLGAQYAGAPTLHTAGIQVRSWAFDPGPSPRRQAREPEGDAGRS